MPYTKSAKVNFENIWKDILKIKIKILYDVSNTKNIDFKELIKNELPEANEFKEIWEKDFVY